MTPVRLTASVSGKVLTVVSPLLLVLLGGYGVLRGGIDAPGLWILLVGVAVFLASGWVTPWATVVDADGVRSRTLLRRHPTVPWDDVVAFERVRRGRRPGPLAVRTASGGKLLLSDAPEMPPTWDQLRDMAQRYAPGTSVDSPPPLHPFNR